MPNIILFKFPIFLPFKTDFHLELKLPRFLQSTSLDLGEDKA